MERNTITTLIETKLKKITASRLHQEKLRVAADLLSETSDYRHRTPDEHPLHSDALRHGFAHKGTDNLENVTAHTYVHPETKANLTLSHSRYHGNEYTVSNKRNTERRSSLAGIKAKTPPDVVARVKRQFAKDISAVE